MTITALVSLLAGRLGNRTGLDARLLLELQAAQTVLEHQAFLPWFLLKPSTGLVTVALTRTVAVPADFIREYEDGGGPYLLYTDSGESVEKELAKRDYESLRTNPDLIGDGLPEAYALVGTNMYLFRRPDAVYSLELLYYAADAVPSAAANLWSTNAPDLLGAYAGYEVARFLRDPGAVQAFLEAKKEALARIMSEDTARKQAALEAFLGG